jgi:sulfur carrier protein
MTALMKSIKFSNKSLILNGLSYEYKSPMTIMNLLEYLGFNIRVIIVDYNGTILPKKVWQEKYLKENDSIEILTIAGGG